MLGIKQEALAEELGEGWSQKKVSFLEAKEEVEPELLEQIAKVLKVPVEAIKNFTEQSAVNYFNTFNDESGKGAFNIAHNAGTFNINLVDKWLEALDENRKLYERLLQAEKEKNELLQKMLEQK